MDEEKYSVAVTVSVPSTDNQLQFVFRDSGVTVQIPKGSVEMSWSDWEFIAKVHGKKSKRGRSY